MNDQNAAVLELQMAILASIAAFPLSFINLALIL